MTTHVRSNIYWLWGSFEYLHTGESFETVKCLIP